MAGEDTTPTAGAPSATPVLDNTGTAPEGSDEGSLLSFRDIQDHYDEPAPAKEPEKKQSDDVDEEDDDDEDDDLEGDTPEGEDGPDDDEADSEEEETEEAGDWKEKLAKEFDENGKTAVTVNGKEKHYTLDEMKNIVASGAHQLEQRRAFGEQVQKETAQIRQMQNQLLAVHNAVNPAWKALQGGKLQDAFLELASATGKSRLEVKRELRDSYVPVVAEYLGINQQWVEERLRAPELREWHDKIRTKEENQFLKEEQERAKNAPPPQQQKGPSPGVAAMKRFQAEHGFKDATIKEAVKLCKESGEITGKEGDFPAQVVANKVLVLNAVDRGVDAILAIKPSLAENPKFVDSVVEVIKANPSMGNVELAKVVRKRAKKYARREAEKLTRDVSRKALRGKDQTSLQAPNKSMPGREVMSFRDLPTEDLV